jgi:hypothetical protein
MTDAAANHTPAVSDTPEHRHSLLAGPQKLALLVGVVGSIAFLLLAGIYVSVAPSGTSEEESPRLSQPFLSYLTGFTFWMLVGFGSVFFLMIQYVTGGRWGILLRRPLEANSKTLLFGFVLFIPVAVAMFMGEKSPYWWARPGEHHEAPTPKVAEKKSHGEFDNIHPNVEVDEEAKKVEWLFPVFTVIRGLVYIGVFVGLAFGMWRNAKQAEYDDNLEAARLARNRQKFISSFGLFMFALFLTLISTDWIMSLEPTFASSMFPVIVFDNAAVAAYCVGLLTLLYLKRKGDPRFANLFPATEQIHLGSLLLAFTLAWTYFNFSQYMLIWIGNLPEEIPYYLKRTNGGWGWYAGLAVIFHFPIPFLLLLFRRVKSSPNALRNIAIMLLIVIFFDVMWWIAPALSHAHSPKFYLLMDVAAWLGVGGFWMFVFFGQLKKHPLLPTRELYLLEAYHHGH